MRTIGSRYRTGTDAHPAGLAQRCQELGMALVWVDVNGNLSPAPAARCGELLRAAVHWPMFAASLRNVVGQWATQPDPVAQALWPGCWVIPLPQRQRGKLMGFEVAVMLSSELAQSEQLHGLCDAAQLDRRAVEARLRLAPPAAVAEVQRLGALLRWMREDLEQIERQEQETTKLSQQLGESYEELSLIYKLSAHMTVTHDPLMFVQDVCAELQQTVGLSWVALQLVSDRERLQGLSDQTITAGRLPAPRETLADIGGQLMRQLGTGEPLIVDDARHIGIPALSQIAGRVLIVPVSVGRQPLGMLLCADKLDGSTLSSVDAKLVTASAQNMAIFLENAMLYTDMQDMFMGMLHSLIASIDAKDSYTCGHSERVAWLSRQLAQAAGLEPATVERVYLSALVHDVGKIGVPEAVLCKPGRLTDEEFQMIKAHPGIGVEILRDIRQMQDLLPGVLHHHERYDGRGYPHGLSGEEIPLFGRLIALADSFDAMSSNRTYRSALPLEQVLSEIKRCAGAQFDPELAEHFVKLDFEPFHRMVAEHQQRRSPLSRLLNKAG